jgi:preprotein translocase subunit YajC
MDLGLLLPLILLIPLLLITFRARKQQRSFSDLQASLKPGQRVITTAGLHGTIVELRDDVAVLDVADGVQLQWARAAIGRVLSEAPGDGQQAPTDDDTESGAAPTQP